MTGRPGSPARDTGLPNTQVHDLVECVAERYVNRVAIVLATTLTPHTFEHRYRTVLSRRLAAVAPAIVWL